MNIIEILMNDFANRPEVREVWVLNEPHEDLSMFRAVFDLIPAEGKRMARATRYVDVSLTSETFVVYQNHSRESIEFDIADPQSLTNAEGFVLQTLGVDPRPATVESAKDFYSHYTDMMSPIDDLWDENEGNVRIIKH
jgi:hypothetical protein